MKKTRKTCLVVYLTADKKNRLVVKPKLQGEDKFNMDWAGLADAVSGGNYDHFVVH